MIGSKNTTLISIFSMVLFETFHLMLLCNVTILLNDMARRRAPNNCT